MEKGNVLMIGNTGAGKSTLINAVLGERRAPEGSFGSTKDLYVYTGEHLPFRVIDSIGFDPSPFKGRHAVNAVKKWSKDSAKAGNADSQINVIWYCLDGTARKQLPKTLDSLSKATSFWSSVPVIVRASSDARTYTALAISSGVDSMPKGQLLLLRACSSWEMPSQRSVRIAPGIT